MIWSLTPMFNELDVLEIRLAELETVVDIFVIAESTVTYSGQEKPLHFEENKERFAPWMDKIRYIVVDDSPMEVKAAEPWQALEACDSDRWARENHQRDALRRGLDDLEDDDLVLLSDMDEIPFARTVERVKLEHPIMRPRLPLHVMYLNWRWKLPPIPVIARFMSGKLVKEASPQALRIAEGIAYGNPMNREGLGWHLSYLGGVEAIQHKLRSAAHHEIDAPPYNERSHIARCMQTGADLFGRSDKQCESVPLAALPGYVQDNADHFSGYIGPELAE